MCSLFLGGGNYFLVVEAGAVEVSDLKKQPMVNFLIFLALNVREVAPQLLALGHCLSILGQAFRHESIKNNH